MEIVADSGWEWIHFNFEPIYTEDEVPEHYAVDEGQVCCLS